jgi:phosphatidylserine/phosphatidylglycerophosphate/cardiolipin synthase-like enzyme
MKGSPAIVEWFRRDSPPALLPESAVIVGGTSLLAHAVASAAGAGDTGEIAIATPWVGDGVIGQLLGWGELDHAGIDLLVVTRSRTEARRALVELGKFPWKSVKIQVKRRLHAKLYAFLNKTGGGVCLFGSHNLTAAGSATNDEAGVMFVGTQDASVRTVIRACRDHIVELAGKGELYYDSMRWPVGETIN